jgi:thioredoxin-related protein
MLLYFTATWCGPCQEMKRTTWADAKVEEALRGFVPVKIDVDDNAELARKYAVTSIPKVILIDKDGNSVRSTEGYLKPDRFLAWLAK